MKAFQILSTGHTGVTVSDLTRSINFFRNVLGLEVSNPIQLTGDLVEKLTGIKHCEIDVAFVKSAGHMIELLCYRQPLPQMKNESNVRGAGAWHLCLKVQNIDFIVESIKESGFQALSEIQTVFGGPASGMRLVYVRDAEGLTLELVEEPDGISLEALPFIER